MLEFIHRFLEEEGFISEFEKFTDYLFGNELDDLMDIFKQQEYIAYYLYNVDKHICFKDTKKYTYRGVSENELYDIIGNMFDDYFNDEDYDNIDDEEEYADIDDED